jgi:hypothetical protein
VALLAAAAQVLLDRGTARALTATAGSLLLAGLVLTLAVLFPINDAVLAWTAPPADRADVRDRWRAAHAIRSVAAVGAFALLLAAGRARRTG